MHDWWPWLVSAAVLWLLMWLVVAGVAKAAGKRGPQSPAGQHLAVTVADEVMRVPPEWGDDSVVYPPRGWTL